MLATWELTGVDELANAWAQAPQVTQAVLEQFIEEATTLIWEGVQERTPAAHGNLKQSITSEVESSADQVIGVVGTPLNYAIPVELGTRPHFPPVDAIEDWVHVKLGITGPEARGVAFAIARKIAARGTQGAFMFQNTVTAVQPELERKAGLMVAAINRELFAGTH